MDFGRRATLRGLFLVNPRRYQYVEAGVSEQRVGHRLGNSMSCNVLERLLPRVLAMIGVFPSAPPTNPGPWVAVAA